MKNMSCFFLKIGDVRPGTNVIRKIGDTVYLNYIAECSDKDEFDVEIDNDGDGKANCADSGCLNEFGECDPSDNDESDCGDDVCEGFETCLSCPADCGQCALPGNFIVRKLITGTPQQLFKAISFDNKGNLILKGKLTTGGIPGSVDGEDELIFKDSDDNIVAVINSSGNMVITGNYFANQKILTPSGDNDFIVRDSNDVVVSYIDIEDGSSNIYLKGNIVENGEP